MPVDDQPTEIDTPETTDIVQSPDDLERVFAGSQQAKYGRFILAALGVIPWIGGLFGAASALHAENEQGRINETVKQWLKEHEGKLHELKQTIGQIVSRLEEIGGPEVEKRLQDEQYLELVRQGFRTWNDANAKTKREHVRRTLEHAGAGSYCTDDVVRLFLQWIELYDEIHFQVIRAIHRDPGSTRADIWEAIRGEQVREDSADADLFKLLIRDLSTGSVIRQSRETDYAGRFKKKSNTRPKNTRPSSGTMESAFEDTKPYVLTELGSQFVHYALDETSRRVGAGSTTDHASKHT